ncbi:sodium/hydrogen exchanger [Mycobacterium intracellulare]|uniref:Sodium/calcium exchanger family protein n=2 Tax=Mycobacterium intracellulare TaxID=1767 RepID=H8IKJ9_MYCIA|nr:sodium/hydrogen exchanger [Mycobacterium intracellulare]AFC46285.1 sodium/calcium exchanger family protein [Mycobacterium intracellulare ATCC 13950]ASQ88862.1 sodium:proton exchanger [Mycobacterium intracellulare subsp. chimaera]ASW97903.1 sodium:proton exchanger [Mycobacterium intracellulare]MCA2233580.1 sodium:proton exchanger [Mycobacterium intracellulare]MCA2246466.1 sodium:proton exchanger [Mycobacterium intracellulare]
MTMLAIDRPAADVAMTAQWRRRTLTRSGLITGAFVAPAVAIRIAGLHVGAVPALLIFGAAVVAASFLLAWAAEAAQVDVSGGLATALLALIAVLPEYAVDLYYAYVSGHNAEYTQYAAANMTGSNRLLMGLGWPVVVLVSIVVARRSGSGKPTGLTLEPANRVELGFLLIAGVIAFAVPVAGEIHFGLGLALLAWFGFYLYKLSHGEVEEPDLIGTAAALGELPDVRRRVAVVGLFAASGAVILLCAKPFADNLVAAGTELGVNRFLLVQWLAPLASEAPEFIIATIFATRGKGTAAIATLISSKVNQWTLLIGSLPISHLLGGGGFALHLDSRQVEEMLLTATQTMMGVALILALRFHRGAALALLGMFVVQFPIASTHGRLLLCGVYAAVAVVALIRYRRHLPATVRAPFFGTAVRHTGHPLHPVPDP